MSMPNTGYSMARSNDGHPHDLPRPICENIAGLNNKPESWDQPLRKPPYSSGQSSSQESNEIRRQLEDDVVVTWRDLGQVRR